MAGPQRTGGYRSITDERRTIVTPAEVERMTPHERADAVAAGRAGSWDDVPEPFRSDVLAEALHLGEQRQRRG